MHPAPDIDGEQDDAHGKGIDEPVDEQKDRSGDEEDPIRQGKEECNRLLRERPQRRKDLEE